jgi:hypothetical protein
MSVKMTMFMIKSRFMVFNAGRGGQFQWWRKPEYPEKSTDLP